MRRDFWAVFVSALLAIVGAAVVLGLIAGAGLLAQFVGAWTLLITVPAGIIIAAAILAAAVTGLGRRRL